MKSAYSRCVFGWLTVMLVVFGGAAYADNPFGDQPVGGPQVTVGGASIGEAPPVPLADTAKAVLGNNAYAPGDYQGYSVS